MTKIAPDNLTVPGTLCWFGQYHHEGQSQAAVIIGTSDGRSKAESQTVHFLCLLSNASNPVSALRRWMKYGPVRRVCHVMSWIRTRAYYDSTICHIAPWVHVGPYPRMLEQTTVGQTLQDNRARDEKNTNATSIILIRRKEQHKGRAD